MNQRTPRRTPAASTVRAMAIPARTYYEQVASNLLRREGLKAIWQLQTAAARAYREGHTAAAISIVEIADAAEREWLRRQAADRKR